MKLYNQTGKPLRWHLDKIYTCDPYGEVEIPEKLVLHCKKRGIPLDVTPVAPEIKANKSLEVATEAAKNDELVALQKQLSEATGAEKIAKDELEKSLASVAKLQSERVAVEVSLSEAKSKYDSLVADHNALSKLSDEQTKAFEICKIERDRALATIEQLNKPAVKAPEEKPAKK